MRVRLPIPYNLQASIISSSARYKTVATGRRIGKTTLGTLNTSDMALTYGGSAYWWVAPTNAAAFIAWERFKNILGDAADAGETKKRLILRNGSEIWCKSAEEPDNLRGEGIDHVTFDEAAYIKRLEYVWHGIVRPMLIDTGGGMLALSTPNRRNLFYQWYLRGLDPLEPEWESWSAPTSANPYLPAEEVAQLEQEYPPGSELYRQEILGEFLEGSGQVFRKIREAATAPRDAEPRANHRYIGGVDWGKSSDFTAAAIIDADSRSLVCLDRFNLVDYTLQRNRISALHERWKPVAWHIETNAAGEPNIEMLLADGLPVRRFTTTAQTKRPLIEGLAQAFELGAIRITPDPVLISELEAYERKTSAATGASTYSAPDGLHDDTVIALALSWHGASQPSAMTYVDYIEIE